MDTNYLISIMTNPCLNVYRTVWNIIILVYLNGDYQITLLETGWF